MFIRKVLEILLYAVVLLIVLPSLAYGLAGGSDTGMMVSIIVLVIGVLVFATWLARQFRRRTVPVGGGKS